MRPIVGYIPAGVGVPPAEDGMPLGLQQGPLVAGPGGDGDKDAGGDGVGEVGAPQGGKVPAELPHGDHLSRWHLLHGPVIGQGRGEIHPAAAVFFNGFRVRDDLDLGHAVASLEHGVKILLVFLCHKSHLLGIGYHDFLGDAMRGFSETVFFMPGIKGLKGKLDSVIIYYKKVRAILRKQNKKS